MNASLFVLIKALLNKQGQFYYTIYLFKTRILLIFPFLRIEIGGVPKCPAKYAQIPYRTPMNVLRWRHSQINIATTSCFHFSYVTTLTNAVAVTTWTVSMETAKSTSSLLLPHLSHRRHSLSRPEVNHMEHKDTSLDYSAHGEDYTGLAINNDSGLLYVHGAKTSAILAYRPRSTR